MSFAFGAWKGPSAFSDGAEAGALGQVALEGALGMEEYSLAMGSIEALSRPSGVELRLQHLGLLDGQGGRGGEETRAAIACFQDRHGIEPSGELDGATRKKLEEVHGT